MSIRHELEMAREQLRLAEAAVIRAEKKAKDPFRDLRAGDRVTINLRDYNNKLVTRLLIQNVTNGYYALIRMEDSPQPFTFVDPCGWRTLDGIKQYMTSAGYNEP